MTTTGESPGVVSAGATIAHYRLVALLGTGGMGKVYKAFDSKLGRTVALKILRSELLRDRDKVRRFAHEARTASSLNHPSIVTIYDVGEWHHEGQSIQYIAMEFVEGESLGLKLRGTLSTPRFLELLADVADGLATAHAAGVVHRDLKPDNIMVTREGLPKIVDFGLAKLTQPDLLLSPEGDDGKTVSLYQSRDGMVIGTIGYMSPEQVEGRSVDHRSDIFSLGCILYEGITGKKAFQAASLIDTLHNITSNEPAAIRTLQPAAPQALERVVGRCLKKDPEERYQSIKDLAIELREILRGSDSGTATEKPVRRLRIFQTVAVAGAVMALALLGAAVLLRPQGVDLAQYRFEPLSTDAAYEGFPAWSPDGKTIAYVRDVDGILQVFVRGLDSPLATQITHASRDCREPFWHPRGVRIYYISSAQDQDSLWSIGVGGGSAEVILENVNTAAIAPDGKTIAFLRERNERGNFSLVLWTMSPIGAAPKRYSQLPLADARFASGVIRFAPDNSKFGLWVSRREGTDVADSRQFWIVPQPDGQAQKVLPALATVARPFPFAWMPDSRTIVFGGDSLTSTPGTHLWRADTQNGELRAVTVTNGNEYYPSLSPDGKKIVFASEEGDFDLVTIPQDGSGFRPLLSTSRSERDPVWSLARREYAYVSNRTGSDEIWLRSDDGRWERPIVTQKDFGDRTLQISGLSFSPDGQRIAYQRRGGANFRVWISSVAGGAPVPLNPERRVGVYEDAPSWSPDGDWIAYTYSDRRGVFSLAKIKVGAGTAPVLLKDNIVYPSDPQWSPRGDWITLEMPDGLTLLSPDGVRTQLLSEETWLVHTWSRDGSRLYGIRLDEHFHLMLFSIDLKRRSEALLSDLGLSPPTITPLLGFSLAPDGKSFASSTPRVKGDLWILDGFESRPSWSERLRSFASRSDH